eukprot:1771701-Rhodomonas_salina.1
MSTEMSVKILVAHCDNDRTPSSANITILLLLNWNWGASLRGATVTEKNRSTELASGVLKSREEAAPSESSEQVPPSSMRMAEMRERPYMLGAGFSATKPSSFTMSSRGVWLNSEGFVKVNSHRSCWEASAGDPAEMFPAKGNTTSLESSDSITSCV